MKKPFWIYLLLAATVATSGWAMAEPKYRRVYDAQTRQYYYVQEKSVASKAKDTLGKPIVKQAAIGAAAGVAAGALSDKASIWKGAGVGALVGAGTGALDQSKVLDGKPMVKNVVKGAAIGTGVSAITDKSKVKGAAVGAAGGAGLHLFRDYLNRSSRD